MAAIKAKTPRLRVQRSEQLLLRRVFRWEENPRASAPPKSSAFRRLKFVTNPLVDADHAQQLEVAEHFSRTEHYRRQGIIGDGNGQAGFLADALVEILQQRAATGEHNAAVANVGGKLRRCALERHAHRV